MKEHTLPVRKRKALLGWLLFGVFSVNAVGQATASGSSRTADQELATAIQELRAQVQELRSTVVEMRSEAAEYRAQTDELRRELAGMRANAAPSNLQSAEAASENDRSRATSRAVASMSSRDSPGRPSITCAQISKPRARLRSMASKKAS